MTEPTAQQRARAKYETTNRKGTPVTVRLTDKQIEFLDVARGALSRAEFVRRMLGLQSEA